MDERRRNVSTVPISVVDKFLVGRRISVDDWRGRGALALARGVSPASARSPPSASRRGTSSRLRGARGVSSDRLDDALASSHLRRPSQPPWCSRAWCAAARRSTRPTRVSSCAFDAARSLRTWFERWRTRSSPSTTRAAASAASTVAPAVRGTTPARSPHRARWATDRARPTRGRPRARLPPRRDPRPRRRPLRGSPASPPRAVPRARLQVRVSPGHRRRRRSILGRVRRRHRPPRPGLRRRRHLRHHERNWKRKPTR